MYTSHPTYHCQCVFHRRFNLRKTRLEDYIKKLRKEIDKEIVRTNLQVVIFQSIFRPEIN